MNPLVPMSIAGAALLTLAVLSRKKIAKQLGLKMDEGSAEEKRIKDKILKIMAQIESGQNYGEVFVDPGVELSYGLLQTRMKYGGLYRLLSRYLDKGDGLYHEEIIPYLFLVQKEDRSLERNSDFKGLLRKAGSDPVMQEAQDEYYSEEYLARAYDWAEEKGFKLPVSQLAIVDTFIHSGSQAPFKWAKIFRFPVDGENEEKVMERYLIWREAWLKRKSAALARTAFRPRLYLELLDFDPQIERPVKVRNTTIT